MSRDQLIEAAAEEIVDLCDAAADALGPGDFSPVVLASQAANLCWGASGAYDELTLAERGAALECAIRRLA